MSDQDLVEHLQEVWQSIERLCSTFTEQEWRRPTVLPGWSVQDNLSHLVGTEALLLGNGPLPYATAEGHEMRAALTAFNDACVQERRARPGAEVLDEFRMVTAARLAALRAMDEADFAREWRTPLGPAPYRDFLQLRIFDCWVHEQDMRRAVDRPAQRDGPLAALALRRMTAALPYVVGRKVGAPDGATVLIALSGPGGAAHTVGMDGRRARLLPDPPVAPTVRLAMDVDTFLRLTCGRWDPHEALRAGAVQIAGDEALGRAVVEQLNVMI